MSRLEHVFVSYIRTEPQALWDALTRPEHTRRYFHATDIESTWEPGAPVVYRLADGRLAVHGEVLACEPPRRLAIGWQFVNHEESDGDPPSRVTFEIEPMGDVCKLTVTHDRFDSETATYLGVGRGWPPIIDSLKSLLETGEPLVFPKSQEVKATVEAAK